MERNDAITTLEALKANCSILSRDFQALKYAISSLKTDEAYQIMYEGGEVFTKVDMVAMLEEIQLEIAELPVHVVSNMGSIIRMEISPSAEDVYEVIQEKINTLKENDK